MRIIMSQSRVHEKHADRVHYCRGSRAIRRLRGRACKYPHEMGGKISIIFFKYQKAFLYPDCLVTLLNEEQWIIEYHTVNIHAFIHVHS